MSKQERQQELERKIVNLRNYTDYKNPSSLNLLSKTYLQKYDLDSFDNYLDLPIAETFLRKALEMNPITPSSTDKQRSIFITTNGLLSQVYAKKYEKYSNEEDLEKSSYYVLQAMKAESALKK